MSATQRNVQKERANQAFVAAVQRRRERREQYDRTGDRSFWASVGAMGSVGWSVAIPLTAGTLFGRWLDGRLDSNAVFMVFFMFVGLGAGCVIAWKTIAEKR